MLKILGALLLPLMLQAALPPAQKIQKSLIVDQGALSGGVAGNGWSRLNMQLVSMPNVKMDRYSLARGE